MNIETLKKELIGENTFFKTPYGQRLMTYADYTASGRSLYFVEEYMNHLQKLYANSHTEDSHTGQVMTELIHKSEKLIKDHFKAKDHYIIPTGNGATGAIVKLSEIIGSYITPNMKKKVEAHLDKARFEDILGDTKPVIFVGPYEHHSNDLVWRESMADLVEIDLDAQGHIDLQDLKQKVSQEKYKGRMKLGSFSAGSNVTGIKSPVYEIARILHENDAFAAFDFAGTGPYVEIDMSKDDQAYFDAIYISPHKFIGGPGSSGILIIHKNLYDHNLAPTVAGGGTVDYVSGFDYVFTKDVEAREQAGTPGILQIIRAALAIDIKETIGIQAIEAKEHQYMSHVFKRLEASENVEIFGALDPDNRVSIMSFNLKNGDNYLHHRYVTRLLNDLFGIQSRAGCACAGPYGHRLLGIDDERSTQYRKAIEAGTGALKPGWVRVNFHYTMTLDEVDFIVDALLFIGQYGHLFLQDYQIDLSSGLWSHKNFTEDLSTVDTFGAASAQAYIGITGERILVEKTSYYTHYLKQAHQRAELLTLSFKGNYAKFKDAKRDDLCWYKFIHTT